MDAGAPWAQVLLTGAGGWVGRNALDLLARSSAARTLAFATSARRLQSPYGTFDLLPTASLPYAPLDAGSLLVLSGFPTQDQVDAMGESAYRGAIDALRSLTLSVLDRGPLDVVYLSSGAASSVEGGVDVPHRTRVYGEAKLADEQAYRAATAAAGGRLCVVRAFALSGPYMTKPETYALGNMILQATRSGEVEVKAPRPVRRSYMAIDDMLRVATHAVSQAEPGSCLTFETAGEVVEVGQLAERVLAVLGLDPSRVVRAALDDDAPPDDYLGDPEPLARLAAEAGVVPIALDDQIAATARWLREARP